jgi:hypothetical protein
MVSWLALTNVAEWATALYVTVELERKLVPLMVKVWAVAPAVAPVGDRLVTVGTGLLLGDPEDEELLLPPPQALNPTVNITAMAVPQI